MIDAIPDLTISDVTRRWPQLSYDRVYRALQEGRLKGLQEKPGADWLTCEAWVVAWIASWRSSTAAADAARRKREKEEEEERKNNSPKRRSTGKSDLKLNYDY